MNNVDWDSYLFHCSSLPTLMTKAKEKGVLLSATAKGKLRELWIKETYGREKLDTKNKFCDKGLLVEQDSLEIVTRILNKGFLAKNKDTLSNAFITGTPDVAKPLLLDIKSSWDIWTFNAVDEVKATKDYYWQLFGYMWMLGVESSVLSYALVNTPPEIKADELYRLSFKLSEEVVDKAGINYEFNDIPEKDRVKSYFFQFQDEKLQEVINMLTECRSYLKTITL